MARRAARKDENHNIISAALEAAGCIVFDTSDKGGGFCDALAVLPDGRVLFVEIKQESGEFTAPEVRFALRFARDEFRVFTSVDMAVKAIGA